MRLWLDNSLGVLEKGYTSEELDEAGIHLRQGLTDPNTVVEKTLRLVVDYVSRKAQPHKRDDVLSAALLSHIKAVHRWRARDKEFTCPFSAYLRVNLRWSVFAANIDRVTTISASTVWRRGEHEYVREVSDTDVGRAYRYRIEIEEILEKELTPFEQIVLGRLLMGYTRQEIAERLGWSYPKIVKTVALIGEKLEGKLDFREISRGMTVIGDDDRTLCNVPVT